MEIFNQDIVMVYNYCQRAIKELLFSQSSGLSGLNNEYDLARVKTYITALDAFKAWIVDQPQQDLPETHPRQFILEEPVVVMDRESEVVNMMVNMFTALVTEMINSASARMASGLMIHDAKRFDLITSKMSAFLEDFVEKQTPIDFPESSPDEAITGAGKKGTTGKK